MATKHVTDVMVVRAYWFISELRKEQPGTVVMPYDLLMQATGECLKVCYRAMERACNRGLIEFGVSLRTGWLTPQGRALLAG